MSLRPRLPLSRLSATSVILGATLVLTNPAVGAQSDAGAAPRQEEHFPAALRPLPSLPSIALPAPTPAARRHLKEWMLQLGSTSQQIAFRAKARIASIDQTLLPAVAERLSHLASNTNKPALKELLTEIRRVARADVRREMQATQREGTVSTPDYLEMILAYRGPPSEHRRSLAELLACSRMLETLGSPPAVRKLIDVYVRFGEFLRVDTQLALHRLGSKAVSALVLATHHPAPQISAWANHRLQAENRATPAEAAVGLSPRQLPALLRAYGRIRALPAFRLLLSYANSPIPPVRLAARQAIVHFGNAGIWRLRDAYENATGTRAPEQWPWRRLAQNLFAHHDQTRTTALYLSLGHAHRAALHSDWTTAVTAFDQVLAWEPTTPPSATLINSYWQYAQQTAASEPQKALLALHRLRRLLPAGHATQALAKSLRYTLDARRHASNGWLDQVLLQRALELDPTNASAKELLRDSLGSNSSPSPHSWLTPALSALLALLAFGAYAARSRQTRSHTSKTTQASEQEQ